MSRIRKDAIKGIDICIAVKRDEIKANPLFSLEGFCELAKKWVCDRFGEENVAGMTLHMDEMAPHIHAMVIPMTPDGRLCCRDVLSTREQYINMQDSIAKAMEPLDLQRGRRRSVAEHKTVKEFYAMVNDVMSDSLPEPIQGETFESYYIRANYAHKAMLAKQVDSELRKGSDVTDLVTELNNEKANTKKMKEELARLKKVEENNKVASEQWNSIVYAYKNHLLSPELEKALLDILEKSKKCVNRGKEQTAPETYKDR